MRLRSLKQGMDSKIDLQNDKIYGIIYIMMRKNHKK